MPKKRNKAKSSKMDSKKNQIELNALLLPQDEQTPMLVIKDDYQKYLESENADVDFQPKKVGLLSRIFFFYLNKIIKLGLEKRYELDLLFRVPDVLKHENTFPKFKQYYLEQFGQKPKVSLLRIVLGFQFWLWLEGSLKYLFPFFLQLFLPLAVKIYLKWLTGADEGGYHPSDVVGIIAGVGLAFISFGKFLGAGQAAGPMKTNSIIIEMLIRVRPISNLNCPKFSVLAE